MSARWTEFGEPSAPALVALHTWEDDHAHFRDLAPLLPGYRIVSLHEPERAVVMPRRVEQWLDHYEPTMVAAGVTAPYGLIGWSFGGVLAMEMTRRVRARGQHVAYCAMIDALRPARQPLGVRDFAWFHLGEAMQLLDEQERIAYLRKHWWYYTRRRWPRTMDTIIRSARVFGRARTINLSHVIKRIGGEGNPVDPLTIAIHTAYLHYECPGVDFAVHLYETDPSAQRTVRPALNWSGFLHRGYTIRRVAGRHTTLFDPEHIASLAEAMSADLRAVAAAGPVSGTAGSPLS